MASLSGNNKSGISNWDKYVKNQSNLSTTDYTLEQPAYLYKGLTNTAPRFNLGMIPAGSKIKIKSNQTFSVTATKNVAGGRGVSNQKSARVLYDGKTGYVRLTAIKKPTKSPTAVEQRTIRISQDLLEKYKEVSGVGRGSKAGIDIEVDGYGLIPNVTTVENIRSRVNNTEVKADFALKDTKGTQLFYISHKKSGGASAFQQYSGISKKSGTRSNPGLIYDDPETQAYLNDIWKLYQDALAGAPQYGKINPFNSNGSLNVGRIYRYVQSPQLISRAVFGPDYGGPFGINNVNVIGQGNVIFKPYMNSEQDIYLRMSFKKFSINGDVSEFTEGDYRAVFVSRSESGRITETPQGNIPVRSGIFNLSYLNSSSENIDYLL